MAPRPLGRVRGRRPGPPPANPKGAIQDWLNLVEPDGAFLTATELLAAFPHGFDPMPAEHRTELRAGVADLAGDTAGAAGGGGLRRWLLTTALDWGEQLAGGQRVPASVSVRVSDHGIHLAPDAVLLDVEEAARVRLGLFVWPAATRLDRRADPVAGDGWPATPVQRAETWCRESGVALALVTDDDQWVLVWAPRGAPVASGRWRTAELADERVLQNGLVSLLGAQRFFAVEADRSIEALFERAADSEVEITKGLGMSVRRSVELLVAAISRDDVASGGQVLAGVAPTEVYEASVTVLMRLLFLLFAEERRLLPAEDPLWAESYSVLTLRDDLRTLATRDGLDALERRCTAWHRLLATFRAVHGGANHDRLSLPAYGGSLFDPDRFAFLEGRRPVDRLVAGGVDLGPVDGEPEGPGRPVGIDDRTVLAVLDALLNVKVRSGRATVTQRVSYKALDVEQIGHCYEGLLDHGSTPVDVLALGLVGPDGDEPELTVDELEHHLASGTDALCEWLSDKTRCRRKASVLARALARRPEGVDLARLRVACGHDDVTVERVAVFWGLIRTDLRGLPIVLLPGSQYVTQTSTRRNTGAQYTTRALAEEVVRHALEPLVYEPGPQNQADPERWKLRTPDQILGLRVCDPAVGSGAILTAAGCYLAERLVDAVEEHGSGQGRFAERLGSLAAAPADDQEVLARREVVDHCLYGVDRNPVAAEMAKLSLWLTTMARERPFTFLDHAIQVGDSLLGIDDLEQLRWLHLDPTARRGRATFGTLSLDARLEEARDLARRLQEVSVVTVRDAGEKQRLHDELRERLADLSVVADTVVGAALSTAGRRGVALEDRLDAQEERIRTALDGDRLQVERQAALEVLRGVATGWLRTDLPDEVPMPWDRQCLHWPLAFPEVFLEEGRTGFDAMVANPPFLGGKRISGAMGSAYREHLVRAIAEGVTGNADLVAYFLLRMCGLARSVASLATNTVSQGDTREVGLDRLTAAGLTIHRAAKSEPWPNEASLEIAKLWMFGGGWDGAAYLDGSIAGSGITPALERARRVSGNPERLAANAARSFIGSFVNGIGFVLSADQAGALVETDPRNREVIRPYLNGADLNDDPRQRPSRWVINFFDWPMERAMEYPACFEIIERLVKPERSKVNRKAHRERWWIYGDKRPALYTAIAGMDRVLAIARVSKTVTPAFIPTGQVASEATAIFAYDDDGHFGVLTSALHWWWAVTYASTLETRIRYTPSDVFETFPQPEPQSGPCWDAIAEAGKALNEFRADLMIRTNLGLTKTYNRVHDPAEHNPDIAHLRALHVALDHAVRDAYGWSDLALDHHHWATPQGTRFTVSPAAKDELLDRLLELNHQRYAAELAAGLHDKKKSRNKPAAKRGRGSDPGQGTLA